MKKYLLTSLSSLLFPLSVYGLPLNTGGGYQRSYLRAAVAGSNHVLGSGKERGREILETPPLLPVEDMQLDIVSGSLVRELVIIDAAVPEKHAFYEQRQPGIDIVELSTDRDGLLQLQRVLSKYSNLQAVHIISHADAGVLRLGNSRISAATVHDSIDTFAAINGAIKANGDILFYGCNLAAGGDGAEFLDILAANTHADFAASDDVTGSGGLDGDWELEIHKGRIEAQQPFSEKALRDFSSVLLDQTITMSGFATGLSEPKTATYGSYTARLSLDDGDPDTNSLSCYAYYGNSRCIVDYTGSSTGDKKLYFDFTGGEQFDITSFALYSGYLQNLRISSDNGDTTDVELEAIDGISLVTLNWTGITRLTIENVDGSDMGYTRIDDMVLTNIAPPAPTITSATYDATAGALVVTGTNFSAAAGATNDIVANKFTVTGEGDTAYTLTDTSNVEITSATSFTLALSATDKASINTFFNKNGTSSKGGTTYNIAAAEDWAAGTDSAATIADTTGNGITVSNVAVPAITSATYDASTGAIVITGTGLLSASGATNDIVANKFTLTGEGGATYTLTDTANVEITSGTSFTLTLSATDRAGINLTLNKNGTSSTGGTTYNLAAAEDWAAGADAAVSVADTSGNGITVSNVAVPAITSATYDASTGAIVVTGTGLLSASGATNDIVANKFTLTGDGGDTYTLTDTGNVEITSGTSFTLTLSATDRPGVNVLLNQNGTFSIDSSTYNLAAAEDWTAGADPAVTIADTTGNGITVSNALPLPTVTDANIAISGASGTGGTFKIGDTVTAIWNNTAGGDNSPSISSVTVNFSAFGGGAAVAASNSSGTWTATYTLVAGAIDAANRNVSVTATNATGSTNRADTTNATMDNVAPTVTGGNISISGGTGDGGAYIVGDTVTASWNNTAGGDNNSDTISSTTVDFSAFGGGAAVAATNSSGTWTATYTLTSGAVDATNRNIAFTATDNAGNATTRADTTNATVDNAVPTVTDANISLSGASGTGGAYKVGDTVTATWNNTAGGDNNGDTLSSTTVNFAAFGGGTAVAATNSSGTWTATYTITAGAVESTNLNVSVTATDNAGNSTTTADSANATVDSGAPIVTDANISISGASGTGGVYKIGDTVTATWNNAAGGDNNSDTISSTTVDFSSFGGGAAVAATNSSGTWTATYTITAGAIDDANRNVSVTATDNAGNATTTADTTNATVDSSAPTLTNANISISGASGTGGSYIVGDTVTATWNNTAGGDNNSDTISSATVDFSVFGGGAAVAAANSSGTWTASYTIASDSTSGSNLNVAITAVDNAGNTTTTTDTSNATVDSVVPAVSSVSVPANATYSTGQNLDFTVNFPESITVNTGGGEPRIALTLDTGGTVYATYLSGSGTSALTFRYTVAAGNNDSDGITVGALTANGGTLQDAAGNNATLTLNSIGSTVGVLVDAASSTVVSVAVPANATYVAGNNLDFTVNFNENVTVNTGGGTPRIALTLDTGGTVYASYLSGSGTAAPIFRYVVAAGNFDSNGITVGALDANGGTLQDASGNNATLTLNSVGSTTGVLVDTIAPGLQSLSPANGLTTVAADANFVVTLNEDIALGAGNIVIYDALDAPVASIDVADHGGQLTVSDGELTINPTANLAVDESYYIQIVSGAIRDLAGNAYVGFLDDSNWAFAVVGTPPEISGSPATGVVVGGAYSFTPTASDADGDDLTFSISNKPAWASFDTDTGALTGTPADGDVGIYDDIVISVSDSHETVSLPGFDLEVVSDMDTDGDGVTDYQEGLDGTDPADPDDYLDPTPPVLTAPAEQTLDATALYTPVTLKQLLGLESAATSAEVEDALAELTTDDVDGDGCCNPVLENLTDDVIYLPPGRNEITWLAEDRKGNNAEIIQVVNLRPLVSLSMDQTTTEGANVTIEVILNGESPFYPLTVPFLVDIASTAGTGDHDLISGTVTFTETAGVGQTRASISVAITADAISEDDETLLVRLDDQTSNAEDLADGYDPANPDTFDINSGAKIDSAILIVERNLAPRAALGLAQNGVDTSLIARTEGDVTVTATVTDPNPGDTHSLDWSGTDNRLVDIDGDATDGTLVFDPAELSLDRYELEVRVTDAEGATTVATRYFVTVQDLPILAADEDSDGDGVDDATEGTADTDHDGIMDYLDSIDAGNLLPEDAEEGQSYLIECESGLECRRGRYALLSDIGGARLSSEDLETQADLAVDDAYTSEGGIVDFEIHGLTAPGQIVRVVIPQRAAIPADAVYRKFQDGGWMTFVEDANNALHSTAGNPGYCPPPGDGSWEQGLVTGHLCVQLALEDGGPNDADGLANRVVQDPGAVSAAIPAPPEEPEEPEEPQVPVDRSVESTGGGGGGAINLVFLMFISGLLLTAHLTKGGAVKKSNLTVVRTRLRTRVRTVIKNVSLPLLLISVLWLPAESGHAGTAEAPFTLELGLYQSNAGGAGRFVNDMASDGVTVDIEGYDTSRLARQFSVGYQFRPWAGVQLGYLDLGDVTVDIQAQAATVDALQSAFARHYPATGDGWTLGYRYRYSLAESVDVTADLGLFFWSRDIDVFGESIRSIDDSGTDPLVAVGLDYQLDDGLSIGVRFQRVYVDVEHANLLGGVLAWRF